MPFHLTKSEADEAVGFLSRVYEEITPFWFVLDLNDEYGPNNIGVSARSTKGAFDEVDFVATEIAARIGTGQIHRIIPQIEISRLDRVRVQPLIGDSRIKGVWWPCLKGES